MKTNENKTVALKRRVSSVHAKAEAVGIFYLIATVLIAAAAFLPILYGTSVGDMWVANFWKAFPDLVNIKTSAVAVLLNAGCAGLYALLLLTAVINVLRSLSRLSRLFKTKASRVNGYNRNAMAMEEMGKIYSGTYCVFIVFPFMIHLISGAGFTNLYYIAIAVGLVFHFWLGLVGGNVSQFTVGTETEEEKRTLGRIAPFFRNLAQLVFVGLIMYYISETNLMLNALKWLETNAFSTLFKGAKMDLVYYGAIPFLQLLCCLWTVVLLKHATAPTEYQRDGMDAPGMKNFRVFSFLLLITSGLLVGLMFLAASKRTFIAPTMGTLFIAVVALAALIEEFCMCRLPNVKGKVAEEPTAESEEAEGAVEAENANQPEALAPAMYHIPLQCISQPGVFMQPNGQPVLIMPMIAGTQVDPHQAPADGRQIMYGYQNPYEVPYGYGPYGAYWNNGRPFNPYQYVQEPVNEESVTEVNTETQTEKKPDVKERKANLAADKKALRQEAALSRKEHKAAAERAAVEQALAEKWMKKAKKQPVEESNAVTASATPEKEEKAVSVAPAPVASESTALMPVQAAPRQPMMETYAYSHPSAPVKPRYYPEATELSEEDLMKPLPPKKWTVTCPDCMSRLTVKDGAFAYRCPECGGVFQLRKVFRAKQNNENTEN
ncbi:MAG TPA: hypothetical protein IAC57_02135 [Candidatus Scatosoma pullistercoris]|uniref:Uncharacterized protein n=1 Tax=Candidatus Scatosoma pullistercoris TaxID=2840934 RepID=A0A9D1SFW1_9FIRM|nr:hypothetical protein [Candidatus Scatosoma pullistercoris]